MSFEEGLKKWLERAQAISKSTLKVGNNGKKYVRIIANNDYVFCFIEKETGNVLKADTWKSPAPQSRGNIYLLGREGVNEYGALYLR